ncbi:MAG: hypothetical protein A2900_02115 [Candidatus Chisholmbacteria bacterium RIFCSPLOWO2_01_FULL_50_28]|uniref:Uncharacterized protein n=1 Tax=Candidatus Chisholmbacteria bacterium RIFCSPHIGHO2_01_FULL_52_32 TaxID=1797591 RepID=A0A1G1VTP5_9BACT|nr:MAG: hypothetical protein A2786_04630 [Candidatus Chisholmbacteria bacterium RIFCSPHIGHO2_01_FULL_52_32]OGY19878.1 MAG: hypothetical protein A2900_02115 [Candidatus Chisholmbacteria bacterium RIFCSPLOWO2_01_FULL_50_28]
MPDQVEEMFHPKPTTLEVDEKGNKVELETTPLTGESFLRRVDPTGRVVNELRGSRGGEAPPRRK